MGIPKFPPVLPYEFRSIGTKSLSSSNILQTPSLQLTERLVPPQTKVAVTIPDGLQAEVIESQAQDIDDHLEIARLLTGRDTTMILWQVCVRQSGVELLYYDKTLRTTLRPSLISHRIVIDAYPGLELRIIKPETTEEPERQLFCQYGRNILLGEFVRIVELGVNSGIMDATYYPAPEREDFDWLIHTGNQP